MAVVRARPTAGKRRRRTPPRPNPSPTTSVPATRSWSGSLPQPDTMQPLVPLRRCSKVCGMPEEISDPSANTQAFQAWVDQGHGQPEPARSKLPLIIGIAVAAVVVIALLLL